MVVAVKKAVKKVVKKPSAKKSPARQKEALIAVVLDMSGSMLSVRDETISGFNEFKQAQAQLPLKTKLALTVFNSFKVDAHRPLNLKSVPDLDLTNYTPDGMTPLFDAIANTIRRVDDFGARVEKILFLILSDGEENHSQEFAGEVGRKALAKLIEDHHKTQNWDFVYMGANQDAYLTGKGLHIPKGNTTNYAGTKEGTTAALRTATAATSAYLTNSSTSRGFFDSKNTNA